MKTCVCARCGENFRRYNMSATRRAKPQFCSRECLSSELSDRAKAKQAARLWSRVDVRGENECWPWMGRVDPDGYGRFDINYKPELAHRIVFETVTGERPEAVCHHCDNPPCCNPRHLFGGTQTDNYRDMEAKGRRVLPAPRRGVDSNRSKLNEDSVIDIFKSNESNAELGRRYGVTKEAIRYIKIGKNWGWLTGGLNV
jgi:HNH endonuclease